MMTLPGLALFYGGLVRAKNILNVLMQCMLSAGIVGVLWIVVGYSLAFGTGNAWIGDFSKVMLSGVTMDSVTANFATPPRNIPEYVFIMFQAMFAIITPALILGAIAERMRFDVWCAFISLWFLVVYCPIAHMVWSSEGLALQVERDRLRRRPRRAHVERLLALVAALMLGKRVGLGKEPMAPHSLPLCLIGAGLLWTGWFGFNAGSALSASPLASLAFLNTSTAASTAVVVWALIEVLHRGKPTALGGATAAVAGLVAITPACGNVAPAGAIAIGAGRVDRVVRRLHVPEARVRLRRLARRLRRARARRRVGRARVGIFATTLGSGIETNAQQIMVQLKGMGFVILFAPFATAVILLGLQLVFGSLRVGEESEIEGLDLAEHSESAYGIGMSGTVVVPEMGGAHSMAMGMVTPEQRRHPA
jgi:Amt family ammonium transporter